MHAIRNHRCAIGLVVVLASVASASGIVGAGASTVTLAGSSQAIHGSGALLIGAGSGAVSAGPISTPAPAGPGSTGPSSVPGTPWSPNFSSNTPNTPLNLSGSSEGSGSESSGGGSGGGLVWGDPLSADVGTFSKVHANLHYFSQSGYNGTQQAVGINFTVRY
jgi:hypothetical protein